MSAVRNAAPKARSAGGSATATAGKSCTVLCACKSACAQEPPWSLARTATRARSTTSTKMRPALLRRVLNLRASRQRCVGREGGKVREPGGEA